MAVNLKDPVHLWEELKQRKVVRVLTVYIAASFALLEAVDIIFPRIGLPPWSITVVMIILAIGLVAAIILSWLYDITPEGIKRANGTEKPGDKSNSDFEYAVPHWKSTATQSREELIAYNNEIHAEKIRQFKKKGRIYSYSSIVVIFAVVILFTFSSANTVPFSKRDWIVITDFENLTEDPVFDKSLYTAFTLNAGQSNHINIFPRLRMLETLARMEMKDQLYVNEKTGREIAMREGIDIYIVPGISKIGNRYVITAKIHETKTGNILRSQVSYAESQDEILAGIDQLTKRIRRDLGESRYRIATQDKSLKKVTTSSLEALKLYSLGIDHHLMSDFEVARDYYTSALQIDTGFVAAKASLGSILIERFDEARGRELLNQAVKSVNDLTERERLGILAFHAVNVENNINKGIEYTKMRIELYPDDVVARNNLGWYYQRLEQFEEALKEYKTVVKIDPNMALTYGGILWIYLEKAGNVDSALVWAQKMISDNPLNPWSYMNLGSAWLCIDSLHNAEIAFKKAMEISPHFSVNLYRLAHTYRLQECYSKAVEILKKIHDILPNEASAYYDMGVNYQALGSVKEAVRCFSIFKKIAEEEWTKRWPDDPGTYIALGAITARLGDMKTSDQMLQKAIRLDSTQHQRFAEVLCLQDRIPEAVNEMERAFINGYRNLFWIKITPDLQALQSDPLFRNLMEIYFK